MTSNQDINHTGRVAPLLLVVFELIKFAALLILRFALGMSWIMSFSLTFVISSVLVVMYAVYMKFIRKNKCS